MRSQEGFSFWPWGRRTAGQSRLRTGFLEAAGSSGQNPTSPKRKRRDLLLVGLCPVALRNGESVLWLTVHGWMVVFPRKGVEACQGKR